MHRPFPWGRCSAIGRSCSAVPRLAVAASLLGFDPSQLCSCLRAAEEFRLRRTHLPFPERPSRPGVYVVGRSTVLIERFPCARCTHFVDTRVRDGRSRALSAAPGFSPASNPRRADRVVRSGRCCLGLGLLYQVFGHRRACGATCIAREECRVDRQSRRPLPAAIRSWALNDGDEVAPPQSNCRRAAAVAALQRFTRLTPGRSGAVMFDRTKLPV